MKLGIPLICAALAAVGGGSYWTIKQHIDKANEQVVILVSTAKNNNVIVQGGAPNTSTDKYWCQAGTEKDEKCQIFSITFDSTNKSIDIAGLEKITTPISGFSIVKVADASAAAQTTPSKNYFLVQTSRKFLWNMQNSSFKVHKTADESVELHHLGEFSQDRKKFLGKTNLFIAKASTPATTTTAPEKTTCHLEDKEKKKIAEGSCSFSSPGTTSANNDVKTINFSSLTIPASLASTTFENDKFYLVEFKNSESGKGTTTFLSGDELKDKTLVLTEKKEGDNTQHTTTSFTLESLIIGNLTTSNSNPKEVIVLKTEETPKQQ